MRVFFLPVGRSTRLCIVHSARTPVKGALLYIHPFAEEMNRSRRMAALQARAFAEAGWTVLQMDLYGCGDSTGDFGDASWQRWLDDVAEGRSWLERETGQVPGLWALRAGCLLAAQAARALPDVSQLVLWQPTLSGKQHLQQFLRLNLATQIVSQGDGPPAGARGLREQLAQGEAVEVKGYSISPTLAAGMERAELEPPPGRARIAWLEVRGADEPELSHVSKMRMQHWQAAGHAIQAQAVRGPLFWQTPEITECPALIEATLAIVTSWLR